MELTSNLFTPPVSTAECEKEIEQLKNQLSVMTRQLNDRETRDNTPPRKYKQWREGFILQQQHVSQRYKYLKSWRGKQAEAMRQAMLRANGIDSTNPINLLRNARKTIAQLFKDANMEYPYPPEIKSLLDGIDDYVMRQLNASQP